MSRSSLLAAGLAIGYLTTSTNDKEDDDNCGSNLRLEHGGIER
jgi:hypothetical protein